MDNYFPELQNDHIATEQDIEDDYSVYSGMKETFNTRFRGDSVVSLSSHKHKQVAQKIHGSKLQQEELTFKQL